MGNGAIGCACGVAHAGRRGHAYNEEAFQYLLTLERKRTERSGRPFLLLLVDLDPRPHADACIERAVALRLFSALWRCLRETDIVGWYREHRVAGAVLPDLADGHEADTGRLLSERINGVLGEVLPSDAARRLQVRVYRHCELLTGDM